MSDGLRRSLHNANLVLAVICPIAFVGAILLRDASEAVLQLFALVCLFGAIGLLFVLDERAERREKQDQ